MSNGSKRACDLHLKNELSLIGLDIRPPQSCSLCVHRGETCTTEGIYKLRSSDRHKLRSSNHGEKEAQIKRAPDESVSATVPAHTSVVITRYNARGRLAESLDAQFFSLQSLAAYTGLYEEPMARWMSHLCSPGGVGIPGNEIEDELARSLASLKVEVPSSKRIQVTPYNPWAIGQQIHVGLQTMKESWWSWCQGRCFTDPTVRLYRGRYAR